MRKDIAQKWVDDLRSGEHEQTRGVLHAVEDGEHSYCCLGRLCEIAITNGVELKTQGNGAFVKYEGQAYLPPAEVYRWSGLDADEANSYAHMNDQDAASFKAIANAIEIRYNLNDREEVNDNNG